MTDLDDAELVRKAMADLIGSPDLTADDDLFDAGGDSMMAIRLAWRLAKATGLEVNVAEDIMVDPTPRAIAQRLADKRAAA